MSERIDLRTQVAAAVAIRWDDFAERHPNLAKVIDQHLLVESAVESLQRDAEYQAALAAARTQNAPLETVIQIIDKYVIAWLARLV